MSARTVRMSNPVCVAQFELPAGRLPTFAAAVRRLSPQPLRFRWVSNGADEVDRVLIRVEAPAALLLDRYREFIRPDSGPAGEFLDEIETLPLRPGPVESGLEKLAAIETRLRLISVSA